MLPELAEVQQLLNLLADSSSDLITVEQLQQGLISLGYSLEPSEVLELAQNLGYGVAGTEGVALSQFAASQLDWENIQVGGGGGGGGNSQDHAAFGHDTTTQCGGFRMQHAHPKAYYRWWARFSCRC
jgi:hypothetical protein